MTIEANRDSSRPTHNILDLTAIALLTDNEQANLLGRYLITSGEQLYVYVKDRQYILTIDHSLCLQSTTKPPHRIDFTVFSHIEAFISAPQAETIKSLLNQTLNTNSTEQLLTDTQRLIAAALCNRWHIPTAAKSSPSKVSTAPTNVPISHHQVLRLVRCEIIDICLNLIKEQDGPQLSPFGSVRKIVRIHDRETVLLIKTTNSIALANHAPLDQTLTRFNAAIQSATKYRSLPKGKTIQRNASHNGLVTNTYILATPSDAKVSIYPGSPYSQFSTLAEDLFDQVDAISTWQVEDRRSRPSAPFNIGATFAVSLTESTHTINQNLYWDVAIHAC